MLVSTYDSFLFIPLIFVVYLFYSSYWAYFCAYNSEQGNLWPQEVYDLFLLFFTRSLTVKYKILS